MNTSKIIKGVVGGGRYTVTAPIIKEDYGLYLKIEGVELPQTYEVDFSNSENSGTSVTMIGNADGVLIPGQFIDTGKDIFAFLYHVGDNYGRTVYKFRIPNKVRPDRTDDTPTPEQASVIDQAISALNTAVEQTAQDVISADQSARSASDDADRAEQAKDDASTFAQRSANSAQASSDYSESAQASATASAQSAQSASQSAQSAQDALEEFTTPTASATTLQAGSNATASYADGRFSFGIPRGADGLDGEDGEDGTDGVSPTVSITPITGGHRIAITDADGTETADVMDGDDYILTEEDKEEIADMVEVPSDWLKAFPTDTASGAVASFPDGADGLPLKGLVVNIDPVQDLHGQDAPYPAGGGKNLFDASNPNTVSGYISATGFSTGNDKAKTVYIPITPNTTYTVSKMAGERFALATSDVIPSNGATFTVRQANANMTVKTITSGENDAYLWAWVYFQETDTVTYEEMLATVQIELGSTATAYVPYENICPISGWTQIGVEQKGKNIINVNSETWDKYNVSERFWGRNAEQIVEMLNALKPGTYTFTFHEYVDVVNNTAPGTYGILFRRYVNGVQLDVDARLFNTAVTTPKELSKSVTFTLTEDDVGTFAYVYLYAGFAIQQTQNSAKFYDLQIELGSTATSYEPYTGRSITIDLGQTVYGGKLDVLTGELVVDRAINVIDGSQAIASNGIQTYGGLQARYVPNPPKAYAKSTSTQNSGLLSDRFDTSSAYIDNPCQITGRATNANVYINMPTSVTTAAQARNWFASNPTQVVYELAEPIEIQLSPNQINSLLGVNNIWSDSGDTEVVYRANTKLYIERLTAPDSADMIADANITSGKYFMVGNSLYKATANIANGAQIIVGTNCIRKSLSEALNEINA